MMNMTDSLFFWCEDLHAARKNYTEAQCLEIALRDISQKENTDREFILAVMGAKPEDFSYECRYLPVYRFEVTSLYNKAGKKREETQNGIFYDDSLEGCRPDFFVGGKTTRIEPVNLPRELGAPLYHPNAGGFNEKKAEATAREFANPPRAGERRTIEEWKGEVTFVPILMIGYTYRGRKYISLVNMHNTSCMTEVPPSRADVIWAEKAARTARRLRAFDILFMLLLPIISAVLTWRPEAAQIADFVCLGLGVLHLIWRASHLPSTEVGDWLSVRRRSKEESFRRLDKCKAALFRTILFFVVVIAAEVVLQFVL